ncbi:MAG: YihY/virulence factor BrkB family protein [Acidimicrobiia bacterium]
MEGTDLAAHKKLFEILKAAAKEFGSDQAARMGAALSYYTIFSLVPLLFLLLAVAGFVFTDPEVVDDLVAGAGDVAGAEVAEILDELLVTVTEQRSGALGVGLLLAAWSASGIFQQVQGVLAELFQVPKDDRRGGALGWLIRRGVALASALVLAVLAFTPIVAVAAVGWISSLVDDIPGLSVVVPFGVPVVSLLVLMAVVALSFQVLTAVDIPWRAALRGGAATAVVGLVAAWGVGMYLSRAGSTGTLGALGGLAVLLLFFNLMWMVFLLGAEVTKTYADYLTFGDIRAPSERTEPKPPPPVVAAAGGPVSVGAAWALFVGLALGVLGRRRR